MIAKQYAAVFTHGKNTPNIHIPFHFYSETMRHGHIFPSVGA